MHVETQLPGWNLLNPWVQAECASGLSSQQTYFLLTRSKGGQGLEGFVVLQKARCFHWAALIQDICSVSFTIPSSLHYFEQSGGRYFDTSWMGEGEEVSVFPEKIQAFQRLSGE